MPIERKRGGPLCELGALFGAGKKNKRNQCGGSRKKI